MTKLISCMKSQWKLVFRISDATTLMLSPVPVRGLGCTRHLPYCAGDGSATNLLHFNGRQLVGWRLNRYNSLINLLQLPTRDVHCFLLVNHKCELCHRPVKALFFRYKQLEEF